MDDFIKDFKSRLKKKEIKIAVVGLGYVGLPLALEFVKKGFFVLGLEIDKDRLKRLKKGESYITDVKDEELNNFIIKRNFSASDNFKRLKEIDVVIICVPTPLKRKYHPDISYIKKAVKKIAKNLKKPSLVILESTTYPGTTEEIILRLLEQYHLKNNRDFYLCFSPERIDPGNKNYPLNKIPKVVGGLTKEAGQLASLVYKEIIDKIVLVSSAKVAEMVKLLENTFRLVNIALIDELTMMAHQMKINIWEVISAAKTKPFGFMSFYPGPGVGGHCIPKDPLYLYWRARKHHGFKSRFIKLASDLINQMPQYIVKRLEELLEKHNKKLKKAKILILGVTYKKDIKDLRKSPALDIIDILQKRKVFVSYYDPLIPYLKLDRINLKSIPLIAQNLKKFDCVVIATDHSKLNYDFILKYARLIFDTRNVYKNLTHPKIIKL